MKGYTKIVKLSKPVLEENERVARQNREFFDRARIRAIEYLDSACATNAKTGEGTETLLEVLKF